MNKNFPFQKTQKSSKMKTFICNSCKKNTSHYLKNGNDLDTQKKDCYVCNDCGHVSHIEGNFYKIYCYDNCKSFTLHQKIRGFYQCSKCFSKRMTEDNNYNFYDYLLDLDYMIQHPPKSEKDSKNAEIINILKKEANQTV